MALYQYSLSLVSDRASFVDDLRAAKLLESIGGELGLLGLGCTPSITHVDGLTAIDLAPDSDGFERLLRDRGDEVVRWLWGAVEAGLLYAFIPGGGDIHYEEAGVDIERYQWTHLRELTDDGEVKVVHPLMLFAARMGHGKPCAKAQGLDWGMRESRADVGCLLAFAETTEHGFVLLEPGSLYPQLKADFA
jgi:hypothetical protein